MTKAQAPAARPGRRSSPAKAKADSAPEPAEANPADIPARRSEPHMKEVGGSGLALWDEALLLRTMQTLRPPLLREGETPAQHKMEIVGLAGTALAAFKPKDAVEAMIASQAVALHFAAMECAKRAMLPQQSAEVTSRLRKDTANLSRAMVDMTEALERRRGKGPQVVRVERVVVNEGGQAVVGHVTAGTPLPASAPALQAIGQGVPPDALPGVAADNRGEG